MAQSSNIRPLPPAVAAQLTSAAAIVSLNGVVVELLKNSLDAGAANIDVTVDHARGGCSIHDDGAGIPPHEFTANGHLCKPYCTSKHDAGDAVLGCNGTFLASLAAVCLVTLTSRHVDYRSQNTLTIHHSTVLSRQLPTAATNEIRGQHGTRVTVRNLFGNLPVRVKQRQLLAGQNPDHLRQWNQLKRDVVAVLLAWERPFSLKIRDSHHRVVLRFKTPALALPTMPQDSEPGTVRPSKHLSRILGILTQAGYISANDSNSWVPASASTSTLVVRGAISLVPAPNKAAQFISIETRPLEPTGDHHELYSQVNHLFKLSSFGDMDTDSTAADLSHSLDSESASHEHVSRNKQHLNARKPADKYPMFFLRVFYTSTTSVKQSAIGRLYRPVDDIRMLEVISAMVSQWLEKHRFRSSRPRGNSPAKVRAANPLLSDMVPLGSVSQLDPGHTPSTRATDLKLPRSQNSVNLSRTGSSQTNHRYNHHHVLSSAAPSQLNLVHHELVEAGTLLPDSALTNHDIDDDLLITSHGDIGDSLIYWSHSQTGQTYTLNARTGCVIPYNINQKTKEDTAVSISTSSVASKPMLSQIQAQERVPASWLGKLLAHWHNPVFHASEANIRGVLHDQQESEVLNRHYPPYCCDDFGTIDFVGGSPHMAASRLSKTDLQNAKLISQVDRKFILIKIPSLRVSDGTLASPSSRLFLIDQHAADERIRVEKLLQELCCPPQEREMCRQQSKLGHRAGTVSIALDVPRRFAVSQQDCELFVTFASRFASWGILYDILDGGMSDACTVSRTELPTLLVTHLPPSILERCKVDSLVLIELLRSIAWTYSSDTGSRFEEHGRVTGTNWVRRLAVMPPTLFEMINSRACRTAIMFNDQLSTEQCKSLLHDLLKCTFPFTCAHGRPSLVPLVELSTVGQSEGPGAMRGSTDKNFVEAWKAHRASARSIDPKTQ